MSLFGDFNYYKAVDEGKGLLGEFNNNIWSAKLGVKVGAHRLALSHQRDDGDDNFDYLRHVGLDLPQQLDPVQRLQLAQGTLVDARAITWTCRPSAFLA